jgi:hypothetical protein
MSSDYFVQSDQSFPIETFYCLKGNEDSIDGDGFCKLNSVSDKVLAKKVQISDKQFKYYVRVGFDQKLYNPLNSLNSSKNYKELNRNSESIKFNIVQEIVFMYYVKYLATKNNIWLIKAEREVV